MEELKKNLNCLGITEIDIVECLLPCSLRLEIQEKLLEIIEPNIISDPDLNLPGSNQVSRLGLIYLDLGIYSTPDIIIGNCSQTSSIDLLNAICSLCLPSSITLQQSESLIEYIAKNPKIFNNEVKIFPATFPQKYSSSGNILNDMQQILEY